MDFSLFVIPFHGDAAVQVALLVFVEVVRQVVVLFDALDEVLGVLVSDVFHSEVVYHQCELDWAPFV